MTPELRTTLEKFTPNETLLGLVNSEILNSPKRIALLQQKIKIINKHLTHFGKLIGSNETITSYVFRYSYANLAKRLGYSKDIIAEALGHEYGNSVTGIYLEQFDLSVVDEMNDRLIRTVLTNNFTTH
jgi:integrase/recombinase XerD